MARLRPHKDGARERVTTRAAPPVCRNLFGSADHAAVQDDLRREVEASAVRGRERWNYDFLRDEPLTGRHVWEAVRASEVSPLYRGVDTRSLRTRVTHGHNGPQPDREGCSTAELPPPLVAVEASEERTSTTTTATDAGGGRVHGLPAEQSVIQPRPQKSLPGMQNPTATTVYRCTYVHTLSYPSHRSTPIPPS